jgi:hypothetical protein
MNLSVVRRNWFLPAALPVLAGAFVVTGTADWPVEADGIEAALLFDLAVLLPALYFWCYRSSATAPALRALALASAGIWLVSYLIPPEHQHLLGFVSWLRYAAIGLLLYAELRVLASLYWAVIAGRKTPEAAAADFSASSGTPLRVARLLASEAAFWKRVLAKPSQLIRRPQGRRHAPDERGSGN